MHPFEQYLRPQQYLVSTTFWAAFCASTTLHSNKRSNFEVRMNHVRSMWEEKGAAKA